MCARAFSAPLVHGKGPLLAFGFALLLERAQLFLYFNSAASVNSNNRTTVGLPNNSRVANVRPAEQQ